MRSIPIAFAATLFTTAALAQTTAPDTSGSALGATSNAPMTTRRAAYQTDGWENFDDTAPYYTADEVAADRARRVEIVKPT